MSVGVLLLMPVLAQAPPYRVEEGPRLEIGASAADARDQLDAVVRPVFMMDGSVAVGERRSARVRIYDAAGFHVRDLGRRGPGPGEMSELAAYCVAGDTVLVMDSDGTRLRFEVGGDFIDEVGPFVEVLADARFNVVPWGVLPDGRVVLRGNERLFGAAEGDHVQRMAVFVVDARVTAADTAGVYEAQDILVKEGMPWVYAPPTPLEYSPAAGRTMWIGSGREYRLVRVSTDGRVLAEVTGTPDRRRLAGAEIESTVERLVARGGTANDRRVIRDWAESLPVADRSPAFRSFFSDDRDRLWVEQWQRTVRGGSLWKVYDGSGRELFDVEGPRGLAITDARDGAVIGIHVDEYDRELVRVHALSAR